MKTYTVTVTLTNGRAITQTIQAASAEAATLQAKRSNKIVTTRLNKIVKTEVVS